MNLTFDAWSKPAKVSYQPSLGTDAASQEPSLLTRSKISSRSIKDRQISGEKTEPTLARHGQVLSLKLAVRATAEDCMPPFEFAGQVSTVV